MISSFTEWALLLFEDKAEMSYFQALLKNRVIHSSLHFSLTRARRVFWTRCSLQKEQKNNQLFLVKKQMIRTQIKEQIPNPVILMLSCGTENVSQNLAMNTILQCLITELEYIRGKGKCHYCVEYSTGIGRQVPLCMHYA